MVMVISVSLRVVLATHVHHDVTGREFFGVPSAHNLCILQETQEVKGLPGRSRAGRIKVGFPGDLARAGRCAGSQRDPVRGAGIPRGSFADRTLYSGRRRSNAQASASSQ